jgi:hypothetical protein
MAAALGSGVYKHQFQQLPLLIFPEQVAQVKPQLPENGAIITKASADSDQPAKTRSQNSPWFERSCNPGAIVARKLAGVFVNYVK